MAASPMPAAEPPLDRRRMVAFVCMVFGMFMAILDIQIVSASLAEIQAGLSASGDEIPWVQTSYLIAEVISIPLSGFLSRVLSTRWMFVISAGGFTLMSLACATSTSINEMIVWRAAQGFIGGGMIPTVFASAFTIFPPSKRSIVSPMIGLVATLAPTIGPTVGGYLTDLFDWHWLFLVNVMPGLVVTVSTYCLVDFDEPNLALFKRFDWFGLVFMALMLGCLEYVLEEGPNHDWLADEAGARLRRDLLRGHPAFFWRALTAPEPIVDLRAFSDRNFAAGCLFSFVLRYRPLRPDLPLPGLSRAGAGLLGAPDRRDDVRLGALHVRHCADRGALLGQGRSAPDDGSGLPRLRRRHLDGDGPDQGLGFLGTPRAAGPARLLADAVHDPDQQHRSRHPGPVPDEECLRPLQSHAQSRRRAWFWR